MKDDEKKVEPLPESMPYFDVLALHRQRLRATGEFLCGGYDESNSISVRVWNDYISKLHESEEIEDKE